MRRATFRQSDVTRAIKAALAAGVKVVGFEIEPGKISVKTADAAPRSGDDPNPWDAALE